MVEGARDSNEEENAQDHILNDIEMIRDVNSFVPKQQFFNQYTLIGLFFAEPHDLTSRIWGSVVESLQKELNQLGNQETRLLGCLLVPLLCKFPQ